MPYINWNPLAKLTRRQSHATEGFALKFFDIPDDAAVRQAIHRRGPPNITDVRTVGSYSWLDDEDKPTIAIPGEPPVWKDSKLPTRVHFDFGRRFIDQNSYRLEPSSTSTLEPLLQSVHALTPSFPFSLTDIVTDRNCLLNLFHWIRGDKTGQFRIEAEIAGEKTMMLRRWVPNPILTKLSGPLTYKDGYKAASTLHSHIKGLGKSTGYHHIINYNLGGLNMLVRFSADAQIPFNEEDTELKHASSSLQRLPLYRHSKLKPSVLPPVVPFPSNPILHYLRIPNLSPISHTRLIKIKPIAYSTPWNSSIIVPQLFLSSTPHLFLAHHQQGLFLHVQRERLSSEVLQGLNNQMADEYMRLVMILEEMRELLIQEGKPLVFIGDGNKLLAKHWAKPWVVHPPIEGNRPVKPPRQRSKVSGAMMDLFSPGRIDLGCDPVILQPGNREERPASSVLNKPSDIVLPPSSTSAIPQPPTPLPSTTSPTSSLSTTILPSTEAQVRPTAGKRKLPNIILSTGLSTAHRSSQPPTPVPSTTSPTLPPTTLPVSSSGARVWPAAVLRAIRPKGPRGIDGKLVK